MLAKEKPDIAAICPRHTDQWFEMVTAAAEAGAHTSALAKNSPLKFD